MRRGLGVLLIACALVLAIGGNGAFSSATLDRGTTVSVADDPNAYVGIENCTVTNNANQAIDVSLDSEHEAELAPGDSTDIAVSGETTINAEGSGISAELVRTFDCADDPLTGTAKAPGNSGQLKLDLETDRPITVTAIAVEAEGHEPANPSKTEFTTTSSSAAPLALDGTKTDLDEHADLDGSFKIHIQKFDGSLDVESAFVDPDDAGITVTVYFESGHQQVFGIATS